MSIGLLCNGRHSRNYNIVLVCICDLFQPILLGFGRLADGGVELAFAADDFLFLDLNVLRTFDHRDLHLLLLDCLLRLSRLLKKNKRL